MRDPEGDAAERSPDTLEVGPSRTPLLARMRVTWRSCAVASVALALGLAVGAGGVLWLQDRPEPILPFRVDEHDVELVLFEAVRPRADPAGSGTGGRALRVDGALLLSGQVSSTVLRISGSAANALDVRAPALPVTVTRTRRFQSLTLEITVRDCTVASRWRPGDRPFLITWRDEHGQEHLDRAGDFDASVAGSLVRYVASVCD